MIMKLREKKIHKLKHGKKGFKKYDHNISSAVSKDKSPTKDSKQKGHKPGRPNYVRSSLH